MGAFKPKSKILEEYWAEYLQWIKNHNYQGPGGRNMSPLIRPNEENFWLWYLDHKMKVTL